MNMYTQEDLSLLNKSANSTETVSLGKQGDDIFSLSSSFGLQDSGEIHSKKLCIT